MGRIVNIKYRCCGLNFDAAIDCDWCLHSYGLSKEDRSKETPIELYCLDRRDWDIRMIYQDHVNDQSGDFAHTEVDWDNLIKETRKWVRDMRKEGNL